MGTNIIGLSRDLIIHPGETLREVLESRNITQKDLATKTATSQQHISRVMNGTTNISADFAKKLEYALGVSASFWINLQANYDFELVEYEESNHISEQELDIIKSLKKVIDCLVGLKILEPGNDLPSRVISMRKFLGIANLTTIPRLLPQACYRTAKSNIDVYVMFVWHKLCDRIAAQHPTEEELCITRLKKSVPKIKELMADEDPNIFMPKLNRVFAKCGITFCVVPHFTGAPVQGFIKHVSNGGINLCLTIRGKKADIFWFTLFHEIAHIINEDFDDQFTDFDSGMEETEAEELADEFARDTLIDYRLYKNFTNAQDFSLPAIKKFAALNHVPPYVVIGRLQKEEYIPWSHYTGEMVKYTWS